MAKILHNPSTLYLNYKITSFELTSIFISATSSSLPQLKESIDVHEVYSQ